MGSRFFFWFGLAFAAFGLIFVGVGAWSFFDSRNFRATAIETTGTVVELDRRRSDNGSVYAPVVEWNDPQGTRHQFVGSVASSPPAYDVGETVDVLYQQGAPGQARVDSFTETGILPLAFGGMGGIFALIGIVLVVLHLRRRAKIAFLKQNGVPLDAEFIECFLDRSTRVNNRSPWRVSAQATHPLTGKMHRFDSEHIWVDLTETLAGKKVRVLYDPANEKDYFVDLSNYIEKS